MLKSCILLISLLVFYACGSSKKASIKENNVPEWVLKTPLNSSYYIGIGSALKNNSDFREKALKMALTEISNSISVTITSTNTLQVFQYDSTFNEYYQMNSKISSTTFLEGYEIIDIFEDENIYYTYIRLSKQKYQELKNARIKKALDASIFKFEHAIKLMSENHVIEALQQQIQALEAISEFLNEDLRYQENQIDKPYASLLMNTIFTSLNQITIAFPQKQLTLNHAIDAKEISIKSIQIQSQNKNLNEIPVTVLFSWQPGQSFNYFTDSNGLFSIAFPRNCSVNKQEKIEAFVDVFTLVKKWTTNTTVQKIFQNFQAKKFELPIEKQFPVIAFDIPEKSSSNYWNTFTDQLIPIYTSNYFEVVSKKTRKDYTIIIESKTLETLENNAKVSIKLESYIRIKSNKQETVYQETIQNIIGIGSNLQEAEADAIQSLIEKIKIVNLKSMIHSML